MKSIFFVMLINICFGKDVAFERKYSLEEASFEKKAKCLDYKKRLEDERDTLSKEEVLKLKKKRYYLCKKD